MNSPKQNEFLAMVCLESRQIKKLKRLLDAGMPLTPYILTAMVFFDYPDEIIKGVLVHAKQPSREVFIWIKKHFSPRDIGDVLKVFESQIPHDFLSIEEAVASKMWTYLLREEAWDALAKNAPEILVSLGSSEAMKALLTLDFDQYAPVALEKGCIRALLQTDRGWFYLIENGRRDSVLKALHSPGFMSRKVQAEICNYCRENGLLEQIYQQGALIFLLDNGAFEPFVKNKSLDWRFLTKHPKAVHWEELWEYYRGNDEARSTLIEAARDAKAEVS
ncbi:MAG: hypothetical protein IKO06_04975, partial [Alphaproteobacteria bacterium]|nr:hypothetical protein [Alphaproteobacteria bacterium]